MDEAEARRRLLDHLGDEPPMVVTGCALSRRGSHWILGANTEAYVRTGDTTRARVGVGAWLLDRATGAIEVLGTGQHPDDVLEDRHQAALDAGRVWVFRPRVSPTATIRLRQWLGCGPTRARAILSIGDWFAGARRDMAWVAEQLAPLGIEGEVVRVDHSDVAPEWPTDLASLRAALLTRAS